MPSATGAGAACELGEGRVLATVRVLDSEQQRAVVSEVLERAYGEVHGEAPDAGGQD